AELDRQELWPGVEADDELAALALDLGGEPVAEGERRDGHPPRRVVTADDRGPRGAALRCRSKPPASALERGLQLAAGAELRNGRGGDLNALPGARVHALTRGAVGRRELAEAREVDRVAALQRLGHGLHEGVDGLARVAVRQAALRRDLVDEILLRQSLPPRWGRRLLETSSKEANNGVGYRLTMRFCGNFPQVRGGQERPEADGGAGEGVRPSLLPVDDADGVRDPQPGRPQGLDGLERGPARGDHVLHEADELARLEGALDPVRRAVLLRPPADDHEGEPELERGR